MPKLVVIEQNGTEHSVEVAVGQSVMQGVISASIPGFFSDCGGEAVCGNCHGYVDLAWMSRVPEAKNNEIEALEWALKVQENSRLTCQITMTDELDGLVVRIPEREN